MGIAKKASFIAKRNRGAAISDSIELTGSRTRFPLLRRGNIALHIEEEIERLLHHILDRIRGATY
ncbi:MAG: hypothetical protein ACREQW_25105 [Candidatus Binatia bacterium]